jgi:hypothetical protein
MRFRSAAERRAHAPFPVRAWFVRLMFAFVRGLFSKRRNLLFRATFSLKMSNADEFRNTPSPCRWLASGDVHPEMWGRACGPYFIDALTQGVDNLPSNTRICTITRMVPRPPAG